MFGSEALGVDGIAVRDGKVLAILGEFPQGFASIDCGRKPPDCPAVKAAAVSEAGHLLSVSKNGKWRSLGSVGAFDFDYTANIPHQEHDANPYGVLAIDGGALVADAGSNTLDRVSESGEITVLHYFHFEPPAGSFPTDAVPTCVVHANDHLWVALSPGWVHRHRGGCRRQQRQATDPPRHRL